MIKNDDICLPSDNEAFIEKMEDMIESDEHATATTEFTAHNLEASPLHHLLWPTINSAGKFWLYIAMDLTNKQLCDIVRKLDDTTT